MVADRATHGQTSTIFRVLFGLLTLVLVAGTGPATAQADETRGRHAQEMVALIKGERQSVGLPTLVEDGALVRIAVARAEEMATHRQLSHESPSGRDLPHLLTEVAVVYGLAGENIARSSFGADVVAGVVHGALMASAGHRENILEPRFRRVGVGVAEADGFWYFAVVFAD